MRIERWDLSASGDLSASFNSYPMRVDMFTLAAIQATISGSGSLNGTLKLQASNDAGVDLANNPVPSQVTGLSNWSDIAGTTQTVTVDGSSMWNVADIGFRWLRVVYTKTAGTGTILIVGNAKGPKPR